jgi:dTDP-4-amino-4,6-dideoxygalactose transaminase
MDPAAAARRIGSGDCGLLPVHLFGQCADLDALLGLARSHNAWVLEDAAQAFGAAWRGRKAGTLGAAGCFSFFPSKNLGCAGDGGLVCTADQELAAACVAARSHGSEGQKYRHRFLAGNFRLDELQAAILRVKLPHVDAWNRERQELAGRYDALLSDAGLVASGAVRPLARAAHSTHVFHQYVVRAQGRDRLQAALAAAGVSTAVYYPVPLHVQDAFAEGGARADDCPAALALSREVLALPIFPGLAAGEQQYVVERIAAFFAGQG